MSPQPPRTPPSDRNIDRNRFIRYVDREVDRRLRVLETNPATTVVQQTTATTSPTTGTTLGPPAYSASVSFPVTYRVVSAAQSASQQTYPRRLLVIDEYNDLGYGAGAIVTLGSISGSSVIDWYAVVIDPTFSNIAAWIYLESDTTGSSSNYVLDQNEPASFALLPGTIVWGTGAGSGTSTTASRVFYKRIAVDAGAQGNWMGYNPTRVGDKVWFGPIKDTSPAGHLSYLTASGGAIAKTDVALTWSSPISGDLLISTSTTPPWGIFTPVGHWLAGVGTGNSIWFSTDAGVAGFVANTSYFEVRSGKVPTVSTATGYAAISSTGDNSVLSSLKLVLTAPSYSKTEYSGLIADEPNVTFSFGYNQQLPIAQVNATTFATGVTVRDSATNQYQARVYLLSAGGSTLIWSSPWAALNVSNYTTGPLTPFFVDLAASGGSTIVWAVYSRYLTGPTNWDPGITVYRGTLS